MKKINILKLTKVLTIISGVITLFCIIGNQLLKYILQINMSKEVNSIGIIGGADGPTAIYVSTNVSHFTFAVVFGICICQVKKGPHNI